MMRILLIWISAIVLSILSTSVTLGAISRNNAPDRALSLILPNGFAAETKAVGRLKALVLEKQGQFPERLNQSWNILAKQAFQSEPLTPEAIAVIAMTHANDDRHLLMDKAFELSRRQQLVNGWMIVDAGERKDIPTILKFYDVNLRTSSSTSNAVISTLAKALANDEFVSPFVEILSKSPPWAAGYWTKLVATPESLGNAAKLRELMYEIDEDRTVYQDAALINALAYNRQFEKAEHIYSLLAKPEVKSDLVRNSKFISDSKYPPFDWQLFSNGEFGASIYQRKLNLSAIPFSGGLVARQLVALPSKIMTLRIANSQPVPIGGQLFFELSCAEKSAKKAINIRIPITKKLTIKKISNLGLPCQYYWLNIVARSDGDGEGFDVAIESISLKSN